jgi:hypothetical protein
MDSELPEAGSSVSQNRTANSQRFQIWADAVRDTIKVMMQ